MSDSPKVKPARAAGQPLRDGDRVCIRSSSTHSWKGEVGTALRHERYGPRGSFSGWLVRLDNGQEVYALPDELVAS